MSDTHCSCDVCAVSRAYREVLNLLAIIHRDGGHHVGAVGVAQAAKDAEDIVIQLRASVEVGS